MREIGVVSNKVLKSNNSINSVSREIKTRVSFLLGIVNLYDYNYSYCWAILILFSFNFKPKPLKEEK